MNNVGRIAGRRMEVRRMMLPGLIIIAIDVLGILYLRWKIYELDKLNDSDFKPWNEADYQEWLKNHKKEEQS